jgi:hypothetical protein
MKKTPDVFKKVPDKPNKPKKGKMKLPDLPDMPKKEEKFDLCEFPSDIRCGDRYPLEVAFPNATNIDLPKEGKTIKCRLRHSSVVKVPHTGWCLVVMMTATVRGASLPLCPELLPAIGHECGVSLDKPRYSSGRLSTYISFAKKPANITHTRSSQQLFLQVSIYKDAEAIFTTTPIPLHFRRRRHCQVRKAEVEQFNVDDKGQVYMYFFDSSPTLAVPIVTVDPYLLTTWVKDPVRELVPHRRVSFRYDPVTGAVVGPILLHARKSKSS